MNYTLPADVIAIVLEGITLSLPNPLTINGPLINLENGVLKVYEGFPHGMCTVHAGVINADLLAFVRQGI